MDEAGQLDTAKPVAQAAEVVSRLAAGESTRQIAAAMGDGWSKSTVAAFANKSDVKRIVEQTSRALLSRSLFKAVDNQALKMEIAGEQMLDAQQLRADGQTSEARAVLKESYGILKLSDQAEARLLEMVGMAPTRATTPVYNFINAPANQAIVSPEVLQLLGTAQSSNLGQLMGDELDKGQHVEDVMDAEFSEIE